MKIQRSNVDPQTWWQTPLSLSAYPAPNRFIDQPLCEKVVTIMSDTSAERITSTLEVVLQRVCPMCLK